MESLPVDGLSFHLELGAQRNDAIIALKWWCKKFARDKQANDYTTEQVNAFGYLVILLITLITMEERSLSVRPVNALHNQDRELLKTEIKKRWRNPDDPAAGHTDCSDVCGTLIRDAAVQNALVTLYALPVNSSCPRAELPSSVTCEPSRRPDRINENGEDAEATKIDLSTLRFHRHGSTSFILRGLPSGRSRGRRTEFALKCVLLPYAKIPIVASKTASYAEDYNLVREAKYMVYVWSSTARWILMDFADGLTLAEEIEELTRPGGATAFFHVKGNALVPGKKNILKNTVSATGNVRLDLIRKLGLPLLDALRELRLQGKYHGDLSPNNIIIQRSGAAREYDIKFIDLGHNYLYTQSIGGLEGPDGVFVAPEVRNNEINIKNTVDLYSLGRILITLGDVGENKDGTVPDRFYGQTPLIARLIEDLTDDNPEQRLIVFGISPDGRDTYESLYNVLKQELDAAQAALVADPEQREHAIPYHGESFHALVDLLYPLSREPQKRWRIYRTRRDQKNLSDTHRSMYARWLLIFSVLASITFYVTAFVSVHWFLRDIGIDLSNSVNDIIVRTLGPDYNVISLIDHLREPDYEIGQVTQNLPARLIGLSFSLAGFRYYQNILGDITARAVRPVTLKEEISKFGTELSIRIMSIWPLWLILVANLIQVRWWPICSAIGYSGCLLANVSSARFATKYLNMARQRDLKTVPQAHQTVTGLDGFRQWGSSMFIYSLTVWIVGMLIYFEVLKDIYVYALFVTVVNIALFYIIKTGANALDIRTGLNRCFLAAERLACIDSRTLEFRNQAVTQKGLSLTKKNVSS